MAALCKLGYGTVMRRCYAVYLTRYLTYLPRYVRAHVPC